MKQELCQKKSCPNHGRYARYCGHWNGSVKEIKKPAPRSKKLAETMKKEYVPQVKEMVEAGTACKVKSPVCIGKAQGFHHLAGRIGEMLTEKKRKIPCCNPCNRFIEENDAWARANGLKDSKFSVPAKNQRIGKG